jgi:hypothetical protein
MQFRLWAPLITQAKLVREIKMTSSDKQPTPARDLQDAEPEFNHTTDRGSILDYM